MVLQTAPIVKYSIDKEALPLIINHDKLPKDKNGEFDFYAIIFRKFVFFDDKSVLLIFQHDSYYRNNLKELTFKITGICGKIELYNLFSETSFGLKISKIQTLLNIQAHSLTKDYKLLDLTAHGITVLECNDIELPANPYC